MYQCRLSGKPKQSQTSTIRWRKLLILYSCSLDWTGSACCWGWKLGRDKVTDASYAIPRFFTILPLYLFLSLSHERLRTISLYFFAIDSPVESLSEGGIGTAVKLVFPCVWQRSSEMFLEGCLCWDTSSLLTERNLHWNCFQNIGRVGRTYNFSKVESLPLSNRSLREEAFAEESMVWPGLWKQWSDWSFREWYFFS